MTPRLKEGLNPGEDKVFIIITIIPFNIPAKGMFIVRVPLSLSDVFLSIMFFCFLFYGTDTDNGTINTFLVGKQRGGRQGRRRDYK